MAILAVILDKDRYSHLAFAMFVGLAILMFGLAFAVIHNHLRSKCALLYETHDMKPPKGRLLGIRLWAPAVCCLSAVCLWLSILSFVGAGSYIAYRGLANLSDLQAQKSPAPQRRR